MSHEHPTQGPQGPESTTPVFDLDAFKKDLESAGVEVKPFDLTDFTNDLEAAGITVTPFSLEDFVPTSSTTTETVEEPEAPADEPEVEVAMDQGAGEGEVEIESLEVSTLPTDTVDITREKHLPTFDALRPEPNTTKVYVDKEGKFDLRLSSSGDHQDGLAYNPESGSVVVCDGLGGMGRDGDVKNFFGFALAHAAAELDDITSLQNSEIVIGTIERAKVILEELGITAEPSASGVRGTLGGGFEWASTIAAVQPVEGTKKWRVATIGDTSVAVLGADGRVRKGFGEAFQLLGAGEINSDGSAADSPLGSLVGINGSTLDGGVRYSYRKLHAEFAEVELDEGERLVVASDAYVQKTNLSVLEADAALTPEQWKDKKPLYGDDTTMAVVTP